MENTENKNIELEQNLQMISEMIKSVKTEIKEQNFMYLLWGYAVFLSSIIHYVMQYILELPYGYMAWLSMPIAGIISFFYHNSNRTKSKAKSYTEKSLGAIWMSFIFSILAILVGMYAIGPTNAYPFFIILYAAAIFATGIVINFKPLIYGGASNWIIAGIAFFQGFENQLLLLALAILLSYIIPGHLLKTNT